MALRIESWGTLAAIRRADDVVVGWLDVAVSCLDAETTIGRSPDYEGDDLVSWGMLSFLDAARIFQLEDDPADASDPASCARVLQARH